MTAQTIMPWQQAPNHLNCNPHEIHLWRIDLAITTTQQNHAFSLLDTTEQKRALTFHFVKHQRRFIAARASLRLILSRYLSLTAKELIFHYTSHGKPFIAPSQNTACIDFNLSHSGEMALCAISNNHPVGVDIEQYSERNYLGLAKRFFSLEEYQALLNLPIAQHCQAFFHIWTQKEAFIKAIGEGLSYPLDKFSVNVLPPASIRHIQDDDAKRWFIHSFVIPPYYAAVTSPQTIHQLYYWQEPSHSR